MYLEGDDDLLICTDLDSDEWAANFLSELVAGDREDMNEDEDESNI